jgi:hypothetical protein
MRRTCGHITGPDMTDSCVWLMTCSALLLLGVLFCSRSCSWRPVARQTPTANAVLAVSVSREAVVQPSGLVCHCACCSGLLSRGSGVVPTRSIVSFSWDDTSCCFDVCKGSVKVGAELSLTLFCHQARVAARARIPECSQLLEDEHLDV